MNILQTIIVVCSLGALVYQISKARRRAQMAVSALQWIYKMPSDAEKIAEHTLLELGELNYGTMP